MTSENPRLLRVPEAAARLAISRSKAYELAKQGRLPGVVRVGDSIRISVTSLDAWIDQQAAEGAPAA